MPHRPEPFTHWRLDHLEDVQRLILAHPQHLNDTTAFCQKYSVSLALFYLAARSLPHQLALPLGAPR